MKFSLSWLKDHLDTQADLKTVADTLTRIGLEVEHIHDPAAALAGFVVASVIEAKPHPNADRLRVCTVDAGGAPVQVVCGAPNARTGMKSVFSPVGTWIPAKKMVLGAGNIRGIDSFGMLCSAAELDLGDDHDGILDLPDDAPVGQPYARWAGLDDPVLDINLTPNRPDAMGVAGIARDLAAAGLGTVKPSPVPPVAAAMRPAPSRCGSTCPAKTPRWRRPSPCARSPASPTATARPGCRRGCARSACARSTRWSTSPTSSTFDQARPLHVFDAAKVKGGLVVRRARAGESLAALDGKTYALDETMVVIADDTGPVSIAGIMGGAATGCDPARPTC